MSSDEDVVLAKKTLPKQTMEYSVKSTDTMASIALKFNTTRSELSRMNRLSSRLLYPGQTLFVPVKIDLLEKEVKKAPGKNGIELVTRPPQPRAYPQRQRSFSPDPQMEELLKTDESDKDVVSEKYLRINGRYITDGQGVVPGVILVTPQTVMFNPSVSDHLVIDRGREAYVVRTPIKSIMRASYYKDVAAMVLGDTSAEFEPDLSTEKTKDFTKSQFNSMDTSNYVSQDTTEMLSETSISFQSHEPVRKKDDESENFNDNEVFQDGVDDTFQDGNEASHDGNEASQSSKETESLSQDETFTTCGCSQMSVEQFVSQETATDVTLDVETCEEGTDVINSTVEMDDLQSNTPTEFTNHDRKSRTAEITREGIDIMDTECTSTPRKSNVKSNMSEKLTNKRAMDDSGLIYTKVGSTVKNLTGNSVRLESFKHPGHSNSEKPRYGKEVDSFREEDTSGYIDASRDSGISEGVSSLGNSSFQSNRPHSKEPRMLSPRSSLSSEARIWLGSRGIRLTSSDSECSDGGSPDAAENTPEEVVTPRPAAPNADELVYLCLKISKSYWCRPFERMSHIMGIPPNRDQERMEHWFAVPKHRVNQLYTFLNTWCSKTKQSYLGNKEENEHYGDHDTTADGLSIVDDTFPCPTVEEFAAKSVLSDRYEQDFEANKHILGLAQFIPSRKSTASSINDDDQPELDDDSNILNKSQLALISRELPSRTVGHRWNLIYSTAVHGISLKTLYRNALNLDTPILLVVADQEGRVFGAFMSESPRISEGFYGTGESLLYSFKDDNHIKVYRWAGTNNFFIKGDSRCLAIGGGDGLFGLWLDEDLYHGRSHACKTFDNEMLSSKEDFICSGLEAWSFG